MKIDVSVETLTTLDNYIKYHGHDSYDSVILYLANNEEKMRNNYIRAMIDQKKQIDRLNVAIQNDIFYRKFKALQFELQKVYEENFKMKELLMEEIV